MCGIAGIFSANLSVADRTDAVGRMVLRMVQRGPDDQGIRSDGDVTLGMCRLAIFDPANGHQPMRTPDGRFTMVFNGAIYNHRELRAGLEKEGWAFRSHCDTEVLLAAYARHGAACLPRLRGMFAFAIWDARERTLFVARDPLGIKPLYYARLHDTGLIFASELNGLLASGRVAREIDPAAVGEYLAWFSVPAPRTLYRGVANLPPGYCLSVDARGTVRTQAWWHMPEPVQPQRAASNY
jgi:asparagine synthase (glutamine-hydrolysing)